MHLITRNQELARLLEAHSKTAQAAYAAKSAVEEFLDGGEIGRMCCWEENTGEITFVGSIEQCIAVAEKDPDRELVRGDGLYQVGRSTGERVARCNQIIWGSDRGKRVMEFLKS
jgi:hypothetical protein